VAVALAPVAALVGLVGNQLLRPFGCIVTAVVRWRYLPSAGPTEDGNVNDLARHEDQAADWSDESHRFDCEQLDIVSAAGCWITDKQQRRLLDAASSWARCPRRYGRLRGRARPAKRRRDEETGRM
jgi:hypothetical protein